jgi:hypothetical protein
LRSSVTGFSPIGAVCGYTKFAICEEFGGFQNIQVKSHFNHEASAILKKLIYFFVANCSRDGTQVINKKFQVLRNNKINSS